MKNTFRSSPATAEDRRRGRHERDVDVLALQRGEHRRPRGEADEIGREPRLLEHVLVARDEEARRGARLEPDLDLDVLAVDRRGAEPDAQRERC
jgi:hypothetical protein